MKKVLPVLITLIIFLFFAIPVFEMFGVDMPLVRLEWNHIYGYHFKEKNEMSVELCFIAGAVISLICFIASIGVARQKE